MKTRSAFFAVLAWFQLALSLGFASAIVWGYVTYQASLGNFVSSIAASVGAISTVVVRTAETVEARKEMLDETQKMLVVSRGLITDLKSMAENQARLGPQYSAGMMATADLMRKLVGPLQAIGEKMMVISIPNIQVVGIKPSVTMTKPFEAQGAQLKAAAQDAKVVSESLAGISKAIAQDGQKVSSAFIATSDQALKVLGETEKTLSRLKTEDLPKAVADLKATSEKLHSVSTQVDIAGNLGVVMLIVGLLLALWCVMHSLGALLLVKSKAFDAVTDVAISTFHA